MTLDELGDSTATPSSSPTYFEVDGDKFNAAVRHLKAYRDLEKDHGYFPA